MILLVLLAAVPVLRFYVQPATPPPPVLGTLPPFRFTNQDGVAFGSKELEGKAYVAGFIFTRCPTICPLMTSRMAELQPRLERLGGKAQLVSFSVDPAFDTPPRLKAYAEAHKANPSLWTFLTGDVVPMREAVVHSFHIALTHEGPDDDFMSIVHGTHFVLVDGAGRIRGYYESSDADAVTRLVRDLSLVARAD